MITKKIFHKISDEENSIEDTGQVAVWSPKLNVSGNSYKGMNALEVLTKRNTVAHFSPIQ